MWNMLLDSKFLKLLFKLKQNFYFWCTICICLASIIALILTSPVLLLKWIIFNFSIPTLIKPSTSGYVDNTLQQEKLMYVHFLNYYMKSAIKGGILLGFNFTLHKVIIFGNCTKYTNFLICNPPKNDTGDIYLIWFCY